MPQVPCQYCGLPFRVRRVEPGRTYYCCSGCALASRLPPGGVEGRYPVVPELIAALAVGFFYFNTVLFWTLALEIAREGRPETAAIFARMSAVVGTLVWATLVVGLARAAAQRWSDVLVMAATGGLLFVGLRAPLSPGEIVAADAALGLWVARGWSKQKLSQKPPLPV